MPYQGRKSQVTKEEEKQIKNQLDHAYQLLQNGQSIMKKMLDQQVELGDLVKEVSEYFPEQKSSSKDPINRSLPPLMYRDKAAIELWTCPAVFSGPIPRLKVFSFTQLEMGSVIEPQYNSLSTKLRETRNAINCAQVALGKLTGRLVDKRANVEHNRHKIVFKEFQCFSVRVLRCLYRDLLCGASRLSKAFLEDVRAYAECYGAHHYDIGRLTIFGPALYLAVEPKISNSTVKNNLYDTRQCQARLYTESIENNKNIPNSVAQNLRALQDAESRARRGKEPQDTQKKRLVTLENIWMLEKPLFDQLNLQDYRDLQDNFQNRKIELSTEDDIETLEYCLCTRYTGKFTVYKQFCLRSGRELCPEDFRLGGAPIGRFQAADSAVNVSQSAKIVKDTTGFPDGSSADGPTGPDELHTIVLPTLGGLIVQIQLLSRTSRPFCGVPIGPEEILGSPDGGRVIERRLAAPGQTRRWRCLPLLLRLYRAFFGFQELGICQNGLQMTRRHHTAVLSTEYAEFVGIAGGAMPRTALSTFNIVYKDNMMISTSQDPINLENLLEIAKTSLNNAIDIEADAFQLHLTIDQLTAQMRRILIIVQNEATVTRSKAK